MAILGAKDHRKFYLSQSPQIDPEFYWNTHKSLGHSPIRQISITRRDLQKLSKHKLISICNHHHVPVPPHVKLKRDYITFMLEYPGWDRPLVEIIRKNHLSEDTWWIKKQKQISPLTKSVNLFFHRFLKQHAIPWTKSEAFGQFFKSLSFSGQLHGLLAQRIVMRHLSEFPEYRSNYAYKSQHFLKFISCFFLLSKLVAKMLRQNVILSPYSRFTFKSVKYFKLASKKTWWRRYHRFVHKPCEIFASDNFAAIIKTIFLQEIAPFFYDYTGYQQENIDFFPYVESILLFLADPAIYLENPELLREFNAGWRKNGCRSVNESLKSKSLTNTPRKQKPPNWKSFQQIIQIDVYSPSHNSYRRVSDRKMLKKLFQKSMKQMLKYCIRQERNRPRSFSHPESSIISPLASATSYSHYYDQIWNQFKILIQKKPTLFNGMTVNFLTVALYLIHGHYPFPRNIIQKYWHEMGRGSRDLETVTLLKEVFTLMEKMDSPLSGFELKPQWSDLISYLFPDPAKLKRFVRAILGKCDSGSYLLLAIEPVLAHVDEWVKDPTYFQSIPYEIYFRQLESLSTTDDTCDLCHGKIILDQTRGDWACSSCGLVVKERTVFPYRSFEQAITAMQSSSSSIQKKARISNEFKKVQRRLRKNHIIDKNNGLNQFDHFKCTVMDLFKACAEPSNLQTNIVFQDILSYHQTIRKKNSGFFRAKPRVFNAACLYILSAANHQYFPIPTDQLISYISTTLQQRIPTHPTGGNCTSDGEFSVAKYLAAFRISSLSSSEDFRSIQKVALFHHVYQRIIHEHLLKDIDLSELMTAFLTYLFPSKSQLKALVRDILIHQETKLYWLLEIEPIQSYISTWANDETFFQQVPKKIYINEFLARSPSNMKILQVLTKNRESLPILQDFFRIFYREELQNKINLVHNQEQNLEFIGYVHRLLRFIDAPQSVRKLYCRFKTDFAPTLSSAEAVAKIYSLQRSYTFRRRFKKMVFELLEK
jgi:ribosomal protein L37AE/L43A